MNLSRTIKLREAYKDATGIRSRVTLRSIGRIKGSSSPSSNSSTDRVPFACEEGAKSGKKRLERRRDANSVSRCSSYSFLFLSFFLCFLFLFSVCRIIKREIERRISRMEFLTLLKITRNGAFNFTTWFILVVRAVVEKCFEQKGFAEFHSFTEVSDMRNRFFLAHVFPAKYR